MSNFNAVTTLKNNLKNILGKKTKRKLVVFCVDDYGSIRTKDKIAYQKLVELNNPIFKKCIQKYDTLASKEDLNLLFDVLTSVKDSNGNFACFTPLTVVANPDFEKIRRTNFQEYFRQPFTETLKLYGPDYDGVFSLWQQGINENIFYPAFHGTEHINKKKFLKALQEGHKSTLAGFDLESVCVPGFDGERKIRNYTASYDLDTLDEIEEQKKDLIVGLRIFEKIFGFKARQFSPGKGIYNPKLDETLSKKGIVYLNVNRFINVPVGNSEYKRKMVINGWKNKHNQHFIVRNCVFEPHGKDHPQAASKCLKEIEAAFRWNTPAIISSHRMNFIGHFDLQWRNNSLSQLAFLLKEISKRWPDVEFLNADQMAETICK